MRPGGAEIRKAGKLSARVDRCHCYQVGQVIGRRVDGATVQVIALIAGGSHEEQARSGGARHGFILGAAVSCSRVAGRNYFCPAGDGIIDCLDDI